MRILHRPIGNLASVRPVWRACAILMGAATTALAQPASYSFEDPRAFAVGILPIDVAVGDVNGDSFQDIVSADHAGGTVSILLGEGDGHFGESLAYAVGTDFVPGPYPRDVVLADVTGDGWLDVVTANQYDQTVAVLSSSGGGGFASKDEYSVAIVAIANEPWALAVNDLDGDGSLDIAVALSGPGTSLVAILWNEGDGTFGAPSFVAAGNSPSAVVAGDVDLDGKPDLVVGNGFGTLSILFNKGGQQLSPAVHYSVGESATSIALDDLNQDGHIDVIAVDYVSGTACIRLGLGGGLLGPQSTVAFGPSTKPYKIVTEDVDANGHLDMVVTSGEGVFVVGGNGDGSFGEPARYDLPMSSTSVAVADVSGDGHLDIVLDCYSNTVGVMLGKNGEFDGPENYVVGVDPWDVTACDLDGNSWRDVVVACRGSDSVSVLLGSERTVSGMVASYAVGSQPVSIASGDFNADGRGDVAVANAGSDSVSVLLALPGGTLTAAMHHPVGSSPQSVAVGDLDGDGALDIATANTASDTISILLGHGTGGFSPSGSLPVLQGPESLAIADMNSDGLSDIVVADGGTDSVSVLLGQGGGAFWGPLTFPVGDFPRSVTVGDIDSDGELDIAVANYYKMPGEPYTVSVLLGNGDGSMQPASQYEVGDSPLSVRLRDVNGDGRLDLAVASPAWDSVSVLLGVGDGSFDAMTNYAFGLSCRAVTLDDLNADGRPDVVAVSEVPDTVSISLNQTGLVAPWYDLGYGLPEAGKGPVLTGSGSLLEGTPGAVVLTNAAAGAPFMLFASTHASRASFKCGTLLPVPVLLAIPAVTDATGIRHLGWDYWPGGLGGLTLFLQAAVLDEAAPCGVAISNGVEASVP